MATSPAVADASALPSPPHKTSLVTLIIAVIAGVVLSSGAIGGGIYFLIKSGKLPMPKSSGAEVVKAPTGPVLSHTMALDSIVANLSDTSGPAYLKMGLVLKIEDPPVKKGAAAAKEEKPKVGMSDEEAGVRDTVLMVIGKQTAEGLLTPDGKERLKTEMKTALTEHNPELKVLDIHFTDFLVQR